MKNRIGLIVFLLLASVQLFSFEMGLSGGISKFSYIEISENKKEDLYEIDSFLVGITMNQRVSIIEFYSSVLAQLPYKVSLTDLYGTSPKNYLEGQFYYGLNFQAGVLFPIIESFVIFKAGAVFNLDYFYFKDESINVGNETVFSVLGNGIILDLSYPVNDHFSFGINSSYNINYLPLYSRGGEFKWSSNLKFGAYISYVIF